jgi:glycosyltransferase involved in cell wall biosynthesis
LSAAPLISIVTPCLNRVQYVGEAVESVLAQDYPNVEHIVTDGGSTDGTLELLGRYPHLRLISEPDKNLYDALNKGIQRANGEIIGHLNSDDTYERAIFADVAAIFANNPGVDAVYGGATFFVDGPDGTRRTLREFTRPDEIDLSLRLVALGVPSINARFFRRRVYDKLGLYDLNFPLGADREFLVRVALGGIVGQSLNRVFYHYRQHAGSLTMNGSAFSARIALESIGIAERFLGSNQLAGSGRRILETWHTQQTLGLAVNSLHDQAWTDFYSYFARGWRHDTRWLREFLVAVGRRLQRDLARDSGMGELFRKVRLWLNYQFGGAKPPWLEKISSGAEPTVEQIFTHIHAKNIWGNGQSVSGSGSDLAQTAVLREWLPATFQALHINTILDIPCGDFFWLSRVELKLARYLGADIVQALVEANQARYGVEEPGRSVSFVQMNLLTSSLPRVDLILCRDCLVHFSDQDVRQALRQIKQSGATYLLTTTFPSQTNKRTIHTGDWRPLNLEAPPFQFPRPMLSVVERCTESNGRFPDKTLALWKVADVPSYSVD